MFHFKTFSLSHHKSTLKIGTDSVLLASLIPINKVSSVLDIGCGCGVISFCLADKMKDDLSEKQEIVGIDIDQNSIEEAQENRTNFPMMRNQQIDFCHCSLQQYTNYTKERFDLIVSNPPYFSNSLKPKTAELEKSKHRDNNLSFEELIDSADRLLSENGRFYLILPPAEQEDFASIVATRWHLFDQWQIFPNPRKAANRIISGYAKQKKEEFTLRDLYIRDERSFFTAEYQNITRRFYLEW